MRRLLSVVFLSAMLQALPAPPEFKLPDGVTPRKHTVELTIDPAQPVFEGRVAIEVDLAKPASVVWVNAKDIVPREASIDFRNRKIAARAEAAGGEFIGIEMDQPIGPGHATIHIAYQGKLDEKTVVGPYRKQVDGEWYAFTTFTPIDARRAFPCFDEPRFKTPWQFSMRIRREHKAFTNARQLQEISSGDAMKLVAFAVTEPLPAEVVAFAVGPFDVYEGKPAGHGTPIRVVTAKGHAAEGHAAAEATLAVLPRLEAYTDMPYAFGKLDHIALPEGAFGAVENPGLITYRQRALLRKPDEETPESTRPVRAIQAHEIAHQWFGDLVTQATWEDVWLSEGFATWLSGKVMDQEQPPARARLNAIVARERIMGQEASSHPRPVRLAMTVRDDLYNRELTGGVYSQIVYQKGAAILLMLEGWLGEEKLRDGLRAYLKAHRFGNASTEDLAASLRAASGTDPLPVMKAFLDSTGIPVVRGEIRCTTGAAPVLHVEQKGSAAMPVCWHGDGVARACTVVTSASRDIALAKGAACPAWVYWNAGATGYYRTAWTQAQLTAMPIDGLSAAERLALIYDLAAARKAGADLADVLRSLAKDAEPEIAKAVADALK